VPRYVSATKKRAGHRALLKNCVDPVFPERICKLFLIKRGDAAYARPGSSRDLDHQTLTTRPSLTEKMLDDVFALVIIFGNNCSVEGNNCSAEDAMVKP